MGKRAGVVRVVPEYFVSALDLYLCNSSKAEIMRIVQYQLTEPLYGLTERREATLDRFVQDIPYLRVDGVFPPLGVLNLLLAGGGSVSKICPGAQWAPFELSAAEYSELVDALGRQALNGTPRDVRYPARTLLRLPESDNFYCHAAWVNAVLGWTRPSSKPWLARSA